MYLPVLAYGIVLLLFGSFSLLLSLREDQLKKTLKLQEFLYKQRLYEITILKEIQDKIGYSLDIEHVINTLTGSLKNIFTYSTVSSMMLKDDRIVFKIYL